MELSGKRFLITQNSIRYIAGSEVLTFELAKYLKSVGAKVTIYTFFAGEPMRKFFDDADIELITDDKTELNAQDFDYIWVHHQVLPKSIIEQLGSNFDNEKLPKFLFLHMSPFDSLPLEQPYIHELEQKISSLSLFNSEETRNTQLEKFFGNTLSDEALYQNPAPIEYSQFDNIGLNDTPKNILIVSNHPPQEVSEIVEKFAEHNINVTLMGEGQEKNTLVTVDFLAQFDVVISIGKTVQYCLSAGIPVYVYDKYGGPGFLNSENEQLAEDNNFAGRGFATKTSAQIASEIIDNYATAKQYQTTNRSAFISKFSIDKVLETVLDKVNQREIMRFDQHFTNYLLTIHELSRCQISDLHTTLTHISNMKNYIALLQDLADDRMSIIESQQENITALNQRNSDLLASKSYQIGNTLLKPLSAIKHNTEGDSK